MILPQLMFEKVLGALRRKISIYHFADEVAEVQEGPTPEMWFGNIFSWFYPLSGENLSVMRGTV